MSRPRAPNPGPPNPPTDPPTRTLRPDHWGPTVTPPNMAPTGDTKRRQGCRSPSHKLQRLIRNNPKPIRHMRVTKFQSIRPSRYVREKRQCWSQLSTGAYGRKAVFQPSHQGGPIQEKMIPLFDFLGPKLNFFSLTVCKSEQYLQNGSEKLVLLP